MSVVDPNQHMILAFNGFNIIIRCILFVRFCSRSIFRNFGLYSSCTVVNRFSVQPDLTVFKIIQAANGIVLIMDTCVEGVKQDNGRNRLAVQRVFIPVGQMNLRDFFPDDDSVGNLAPVRIAVHLVIFAELPDGFPLFHAVV